MRSAAVILASALLGSAVAQYENNACYQGGWQANEDEVAASEDAPMQGWYKDGEKWGMHGGSSYSSNGGESWGEEEAGHYEEEEGGSWYHEEAGSYYGMEGGSYYEKNGMEYYHYEESDYYTSNGGLYCSKTGSAPSYVQSVMPPCTQPYTWGAGYVTTFTLYEPVVTTTLTVYNGSVTTVTVTATNAGSLTSLPTTCVTDACYNEVKTVLPGRNAAGDCSAYLGAVVTQASTTTTTSVTSTETSISTSTILNPSTITVDGAVFTSTVFATVFSTAIVNTTTTSTSTATFSAKAKRANDRVARQLIAPAPGVAASTTIPAYASDCQQPSAYASACYCALSIAPFTNTVTAPTATSTSTFFSTITQTAVVTAAAGTVTLGGNTTTTTAFTTLASTTTTTITVTVLAPAPTCNTFQLMAVGGDFDNQYASVVAANDGFDDYIVTFQAGIAGASTFFYNALNGDLSDVATGRFANVDAASGSNEDTVYFNTVAEIVASQGTAVYLFCQSNGVGLTCTSPAGNVFSTNSALLGVAIGAAGQTAAGYVPLTFAIVNQQNVACPAAGQP